MNPRLLARSGVQAELDFESTASIRIGSGTDVEVRIEQPGVLALHVTIERKGAQLRLSAAEANALTYLNGRRIVSEGLQHLDVITLGRGVDLIYVAT